MFGGFDFTGKLSQFFITNIKKVQFSCTVDILDCAHVWRGGCGPCVRLHAVPKEGKPWQTHECSERRGTRNLCDWTPNRTPNPQIWFWSVAQAMRCDESCKYSCTFLTSVTIFFLYYRDALKAFFQRLAQPFSVRNFFHLLMFYMRQISYI